MSIGDLESPKLDTCNGEECSVELHYFMWLVETFQIFFVNIMLLNFLIALISSSYESFMSQAELYAYKNKIELTLEYYQVRDFLGLDKDDKFNLIIMFQRAKDDLDEESWQSSYNALTIQLKRMSKEISQKLSALSSQK